MTSRLGRMAVTCCAVAAVIAAAPARASAQSVPPVRTLAPTDRKVVGRDEVPESHLPPRGLCRIWIDNVPPAQQPAPTDCANAIRNRPSNGRVIFPEDGARGRQDGKDAKEKQAKSDGRDEKGSRGVKLPKSRRPGA